jgi:hypothetical protein
MEGRDTQRSYIASKSLVEPLEACRPQEGLKSKAPKHLEVLGRSTRHAPHREAFIPDVKPQVSRAGWQGCKGAPTSKVTHPGRPTRLAEPYTYRGIARPRY